MENVNTMKDLETPLDLKFNDNSILTRYRVDLFPWSNLYKSSSALFYLIYLQSTYVRANEIPVECRRLRTRSMPSLFRKSQTVALPSGNDPVDVTSE